jgi:hypothetical protein
MLAFSCVQLQAQEAPGLPDPVATPSCNSLDVPINNPKNAAGILECVDSLERRGHGFETRVGTWDRQLLDEKWSEGMELEFNCVGTIWAQRGSHLLSTDDLIGTGVERGRIVAKIQFENAANKLCRAYREMPAGTAYLWVDDYRVVDDTSGTARLVATVVNETLTATVMKDPIRVCRHPREPNEIALARWTHKPIDAGGWWTCAETACCNW